MALETPKMLVLSTAHITKETDWNLTHQTDDCPTTYYPKTHIDGTQYGWVFPLSDDYPWSHMVSSDLKAIRQLAEKNGCTWIMLDRDADVVDELPSWDW